MGFMQTFNGNQTLKTHSIQCFYGSFKASGLPHLHQNKSSAAQMPTKPMDEKMNDYFQMVEDLGLNDGDEAVN